MTAQELALKSDSPVAEITNANDIMMNSPLMAQIDLMAKRMATSKATIPDHLKGNEGDCWAIVMQAVQWGMNPFAVAQKTHVNQGGQLGYEAQLINAAITTMAPISSRPDYEFLGDWSKILGKIEERKGNSGGKYYVAAWDKKLEEGLGVICRCTLRGEDKPREITVMMAQCYPRFSTQWATDPQQQITYVAVRKWARRYTPDVILGVYTPDELQESIPTEREVGPGAVSSDLNDMLKPKTATTDVAEEAEEAEILDPDEEEGEPLPLAATYAEVMEAINKADSPETMEDAKKFMMDFALTEGNEKFQEELGKAWRDRAAVLKKQQEAEEFGDE